MVELQDQKHLENMKSDHETGFEKLLTFKNRSENI